MSHILDFTHALEHLARDPLTLTEKEFLTLREFGGPAQETEARKARERAAGPPPPVVPRQKVPAGHAAAHDRELATAIITATSKALGPMLREHRTRAEAQDARIAQLEKQIKALEGCIELGGAHTMTQPDVIARALCVLVEGYLDGEAARWRAAGLSEAAITHRQDVSRDEIACYWRAPLRELAAALREADPAPV